MSTGKRLAKRSIIGTRVCAPGDDGKYYSGVISAVNTPASPQQQEMAGLSITPNTRYSVRFDPVPPGSKAPDSKNEYSGIDLIGPGFSSVTGARLVPGQKVYLTYNGREIQAQVTQHREHLDEVDVIFVPSNQEGTTMNLTKRIDEVRLLESRKSARLADSDTDFARLADMGSDRKRQSSHSIDVPQTQQIYGSRKRRPSSSNDSERSYNGGSETRTNNQQIHYMDECSAAMVLMSLSTPPKNPLPFHCQQLYGSWDSCSSSNRVAVGSPGVGGTSNSSSSSASWRSGTPSPPLSDEGVLSSNGTWSNNGNNVDVDNVNHPQNLHQHTLNQRFFHPYHQQPRLADSTSSTSPTGSSPRYDEGIGSDFSDQERPRKKKIRCREEIEEERPQIIRNSPSTSASPSPTYANTNGTTTMHINLMNRTEDDQIKPITIYRCTWRDNQNVRCNEIGYTWDVVAAHVLEVHLGGKKTYENEEDFYIVDEQIINTSLPPTKSHWDMVRPRSEDPEYQKQIRHSSTLVPSTSAQSTQAAAAVNTQDIIIRDVIPMTSSNQPAKQFKPSPPSRPVPQQQQLQQQPQQQPQQPQQQQQQQYSAPNISVVTVSLGKMPQSPQKVRGDTKKCRKVYGMEKRDTAWCKQCKWKKACSRFVD